MPPDAGSTRQSNFNPDASRRNHEKHRKGWLREASSGTLSNGKMKTPSAYGLVFSWKGRNHTVEQEAPFDVDEVVTKAAEWADKLENSGLPKGWSRKP